MERFPHGRYKMEAGSSKAGRVEEGLSVHETAKRLSLAPTTLSNWVKVKLWHDLPPEN